MYVFSKFNAYNTNAHTHARTHTLRTHTRTQREREIERSIWAMGLKKMLFLKQKGFQGNVWPTGFNINTRRLSVTVSLVIYISLIPSNPFLCHLTGNRRHQHSRGFSFFSLRFRSSHREPRQLLHPKMSGTLLPGLSLPSNWNNLKTFLFSGYSSDWSINSSFKNSLKAFLFSEYSNDRSINTTLHPYSRWHKNMGDQLSFQSN